jgi:3-methyladenine DNA glycosylase Mpg
LNGVDITGYNSRLALTEGKHEDFEIGSSNRIGVTKDLPQELRFFIKGNKFLSR